MRLVTWNCCTGPLDRKLRALKRLKADIAVVPECPSLPASPGATSWIGTNPRKGLAVIARGPWRITPLQVSVSLPRYTHLLDIEGPEHFRLWAVWPQNDGVDRYVRGMHRAIDLCRHLIEAVPTVMLGDFNSNVQWDKEHPRDRNHSALVAKLADLGLRSAYHAYHGKDHGREGHPTFFEYRHKNKPYHIDYCFLPAAWESRITRVTVGRHGGWSPLSDHMPLTVELSAAAV